MAIHTDGNLFSHDFTEQELYGYYLSLLRGQFDSFIKEDETLIYDSFRDKAINYDLSTTDTMIEAMKIGFERTVEESRLCSKNWFLAVRIQVLLWIRIYLENCIKTNNFTTFKVNLPDKPEYGEITGNQGFFIVNSEKNLPVLHKELLTYSLIDVEDLSEFKQAIQQGNGFITWKGANSCLAYLLEELSCKKIILTPQFWKKSENIFKIKGRHSALRSSTSQVGRKNKILIDRILKVLTLD